MIAAASGRFKTSFDHARYEIARDTQEATRAFSAPLYPARSGARFRRASRRASSARRAPRRATRAFKMSLLATEPLEIVVTVNHGAGIIAVRLRRGVKLAPAHTTNHLA